jgi:poly(3-hydroxybutyrate) depolymerase
MGKRVSSVALSRLSSSWTALSCAALAARATSCHLPPAAAGLDPEVRVAAGVAPSAVDLGDTRWQPGLSEERWNVGAQGQRSARLWIPDAPRPRSVVVLLHGAIVKVPGQRGMEPDAATRALITCLAEPALNELAPLIIAPHSVDGLWWKATDTEFVLGLVAAAQRRWPELATRSVIMGYSNGGIATWYFARLYPEYFSAAIPMAFNESIAGPTPLPIYAIQGERDELFPIAPIRAATSALQAKGFDVTLRVRYRAGHMNPCAYEPELALAGQWLERHAFPKARAQTPTPGSSFSAP